MSTKEIVMVLPEDSLVRFGELSVGDLFVYQSRPFVKTTKATTGHDVNAQRIYEEGEVPTDARHGSIFISDHKVRQIKRATFEVQS